jgi:glutathione S-transferase
MLKLCGFHLSNYHNKVRVALMEKGVPFEEDLACKPSQKDEFLARSAMGKVPFLELDGGRRLVESDVIFEYLEDAYPQKPLLPKDPYARAKVREIVTVMELHVELVARRLYGEVFFKRPPMSTEAKEAVGRDLAKGVRALKQLARFEPYIAGKDFTIADCAAFVHLPLVSITTKHGFGRDVFEDWAPLKGYLKMLGERPAFKKVNEDRKAAQSAAVSAGG